MDTIINTLRGVEAFAVDQILARVPRRLAGAQDIEDGGILGWQVGGKGVPGAGVFLACAADAALDGHCLETQ